MTEPMITLPVSQYNALVRQARDQGEFVAREREALAEFVNEIATKVGGSAASALRGGLSAFLRSEGELPVVET